MLPTHIIRSLGLDEAYTEAQLLDALRQIEFPHLNIIHSQEGIDFLLQHSRENILISSTIEGASAARDNADWRYARFAVGVHEAVEVICIPDKIEGKEVPTTIQKMLVDAWISRPDIIAVEPCGTSSSLTPGIALLFWHDGDESISRLKPRIREVVSVLLGLNEPEPVIQYREAWREHNTFELVDQQKALIGSVNLIKLFKIATNEQSIKWKFLGFYRILEFGYLSNVLEGIQQQFLKDPNSAINDASDALKNEFNQFRKLSKENGLDVFFENLEDSFKILVQSHNQFACALEVRAGKDARLKAHTGSAAKGILITYLIRCAIVHAGEGALLFESYPDAESALHGLQDNLELAVLNYLGIKSTAEITALPFPMLNAPSDIN